MKTLEKGRRQGLNIEVNRINLVPSQMICKSKTLFKPYITTFLWGGGGGMGLGQEGCVLLSSPDWPGTIHVDQVGLKLRLQPALQCC